MPLLGWFGFQRRIALKAQRRFRRFFFNTLFATAVAGALCVVYRMDPEAAFIASRLLSTRRGPVASRRQRAMGARSVVVRICALLRPASSFLLAATKLSRCYATTAALHAFVVHCKRHHSARSARAIYVAPKLGGQGGLRPTFANKVGDRSATDASYRRNVASSLSLSLSGGVALVNPAGC